jgi:hypothetical protein
MLDRKSKSRPKRSRRSRPSGNNTFNPVGFSASQSQKVRSVFLMTYASDGSGVCAGVIPFDPTSSHLAIPEFTSDWANLYTQYRLWGVRIRLVSAIVNATIETKSANYKPIAVGFQFRSTATLATPTAYSQVLDNQPSKIWNVSTDTSPSGIILTQKTPSLVTYLETNASTSPGNAGAPGGFQFYGDTFSTSIPIFTVFLELYYQLRSRS